MKFLLMMNKKLLTILLILICSLSFNFLKAEEDCFIKLDRTKGFVYDEANLFSENQKRALRNKLNKFQANTSNQILVVTVKDLCGEDKASFTTNLGHRFGVGGKEEDNGVVVLVKPKEIDGKGSWYIAVGMGLEGVLNDAKAGRIGRNEMLPFFKKKQYFEGINAAIDVIIPIAKKEFNYQTYQENVRKKNEGGGSFFLLLILFGVFYLLARVFSSRRYAQTNGTGFWTAFWMGSLLGGMGGSSNRGGWDDFNSGGGGFGGFGGGDFGGGGAGGDW